MLSLEPISLTVVDAASAAIETQAVLPQTGLPVLSQFDSFVASQTDLTEKPLTLCLAENEHLTKALDQALSDVRHLVAASGLAGCDVSIAPFVAETPTDVEALTDVEAPVSAEQPVVVEQSIVVKQPVVVAVPDDGRAVALRQPSESPVNGDFVETSIVARPEAAPCQAEQPVVTEQPVVVETPVVTEQLVVVEEPVISASLVVEMPDDGRAVAPRTPSESSVNGDFIGTSIAARHEVMPYQAEQPVIADQPIAVEQSIVVEQSIAVEQPIVVDQSVVVETPAIFTSPVVEVPGDGRTVAPQQPSESPANGDFVGTLSAVRPDVAPYQADQPVAAETPVVVEQSVVVGQSVVDESPIGVAVSDDVEGRSLNAPSTSRRVEESSEIETNALVAASPSADAIVAAGIVPAPEIAVAAQRTAEASAVSMPSVAVAPQTASSVMPSQALVETASAVADALIVTPGLMRGEGVVTVQLKSDVLDGAQVAIAVNGRQMEVAFASGSAAAAALIERNLPQIQQYLGARIHSFTIGVKLNRTRS